MQELEGGGGVVVEAADEAGVEAVGDGVGVEQGAQLGEVVAAGGVEELVDGGQGGDDGLVGGHLAVEHAQGVGLGAALAVGAHAGELVVEGGAEGGVVEGAVAGATDGVEHELGAVDAATFK